MHLLERLLAWILQAYLLPKPKYRPIQSHILFLTYVKPTNITNIHSSLSLQISIHLLNKVSFITNIKVK
jgi:hypothetical protein